MKQKTIAAIILTVVVLAALSIPQGFAISGKSPHGTAHGTYYTRTSLRGVSNAASASPSSNPASCGDLGFTGKFGTVMFYRGAIAVQVQNANPNRQYSVWLGYKTSKTGCDGSWGQLGWVSTNEYGNGGYAQSLNLKSDTQYQVVVRDAAGNTIYATAFFST
jgi:hypothetical protein